MKCPKCSGTITAPPEDSGSIVCPHCGARLRSRSQDKAPPVVAGTERPSRPNPNATLPPGTPLPKIERPEPPAEAIRSILAEIRALRKVQDEILGLLQRGASPPGEVPEEVQEPPAPLRSRRRKSVLVIDDDEEARQVVVSALEHAEVPVRTAIDGTTGLAAVASDKPDVIVLELDLKGSMAGKDVINMIKATMEWVDIPIVLYTRVPIESQKEARTIHGADEFVIKGPGGPEALVARVIAVFRKG